MEKINNFEDLKGQLDKLVEDIKKDAEKFYTNDNKAAGVRLRKGLKAIKSFVQEASNATSSKNK